MSTPTPTNQDPHPPENNKQPAGSSTMQNSQSASRGPGWLRHWAIIIILLMVLVVTSAVGVSKLEERDQFCIQCHMAPEETYYARAQEALAVEDPFELVDLSSFHYWDAVHNEHNNPAGFRCIDCHRGNDGPIHRAETLVLAAKDTFIWLAGEPDETVEKGAVANLDPNTSAWAGPEQYSNQADILNAGCLKCHQDALTLIGFDNHFHNRLPAAQEAFAQTGRLNYPEDWPEGVGSEDLLQADETILTCLDCHRTHVQGFESEFFLDTGQIVFPACVQCHLETGRGPLDLAR
jgi:hypothetical protein